MEATYNPWLVTLSVLVAMVVSYTALTLTARVAESSRPSGRFWLLGGAMAMGIGIWSMHFIGMLAYSVPIQLRYDILKTLLSLVLAVVTSGFALAIASRTYLSGKRLTVGALVMGAGICSMHYTGMFAIPIAPSIRWDMVWVVASFVIAVGASAAALWLAYRLRGDDSVHLVPARSAAAAVMGLAISGTHYTGMVACHIVEGAVCFSGSTFDSTWLALAIGMFSLGLLAIALIASIYDANQVARVREDSKRLEEANAALQHGRNLLSLATQAAGISLWELNYRERRLVWIENVLPSLADNGVDLKKNPNAGWELSHPDDAGILDEAVEAAMKEGRENCRIQTRMLPKPDKTIYVESHLRIFSDSTGRPERLMGVSWEITDRIEQEQREKKLQESLRQASREAGMAEVAAGVLHNIGNALNSLSVSSQVVQTRLQESRVDKLSKLASLLESQGEDLSRFLTEDEQGRNAVAFLGRLSETLAEERDALVNESKVVDEHVSHIRNIVAAQQAFTGQGGVTEAIDLIELLDQCVTGIFTADRHATVRRDYKKVPPWIGDRHKLMQILVNLLTNAKQAMQQGPREGAANELTLRIGATGETESICIRVEDTGVGITSGQMARLFEFGFTTKADGHGYGLHHSALHAQELGGELSAHSDGAGHGAAFELRLPLTPVTRGASATGEKSVAQETSPDP